MEALRREKEALRQRVRNNENTVVTVGSTSPTASMATSLNTASRNVPPPPTAIAPPEPRRAVPPSSAPVPSLVPPPPTFSEFMATVPGASGIPLNPEAPRASRSLQTACDVPMPGPPMAQTAPTGATIAPGPYCPGLLPLTTLLAPFTEVISHRAYRLRITRGEVSLVDSGNVTRIKRRFDDLYLGFAPFDGSIPIPLLEFLTTLRDGFNALEASEAVASLLLTY